MKLDIRTIEMLSQMRDDRLWYTLRMFASGKGVEIPERMRHRLHYDAIRETVSRLTEQDVKRINELGEIYQDAKRGGMRR